MQTYTDAENATIDRVNLSRITSDFLLCLFQSPAVGELCTGVKNHQNRLKNNISEEQSSIGCQPVVIYPRNCQVRQKFGTETLIISVLIRFFALLLDAVLA